jgi:hypothetical protein
MILPAAMVKPSNVVTDSASCPTTSWSPWRRPAGGQDLRPLQAGRSIEYNIILVELWDEAGIKNNFN